MHRAPSRPCRIRPMALSHLDRLEAESLHLFREVAAQFRNPVLLYSIGKDSTVLLHLLKKAFYPARPPIPLLHIDSTFEFRQTYAFRNEVPGRLDVELRVHINEDGLKAGISPFIHGAAVHTDVMRTQGLRQALSLGGSDCAIGGARRDEEKSRAKERLFSFRDANQRWDPKRQRPEFWDLYNGR
ncbi:MAG: sulfate adenylyltransferase subunit CysD, partial [Silanimonas sp.]